MKYTYSTLKIVFSLIFIYIRQLKLTTLNVRIYYEYILNIMIDEPKFWPSMAEDMGSTELK